VVIPVEGFVYLFSRFKASPKEKLVFAGTNLGLYGIQALLVLKVVNVTNLCF
jgi:hypothetical protein